MLITACKSILGFFLTVAVKISETVRNKLKLKTVRTERVIINTFGQTGGSEVRKLDVVQFKVKHRTDSMFTAIQALCVPTVCSPLPTSICA